jgi:hypothetical protein
MDDFIEYLTSKKIDPEQFLKQEPSKFNEFKNIFLQIHPDSFTAQKLYVINGLRRRYPVKEKEEIKSETKPKIRPVIPKKK